jgi:acyl-[acyl-carrier-protein]-phospholipid O-acyltransferase/long-chain-fatty-acid--[acyl-carrier-protein] ligase
VTRLLNGGQVVCLFPEGTMSKNAQLGEFKRGFERAAAAVDPSAGVCILPFYLRGLWGSRFSHASDKLKRSQAGGRPRDVIVAFGPVLPIGSGTDRVKQAVFELSVNSWEEHAAALPTLPVGWLKAAKRSVADTAVIDADGSRLSNRRLIAAVLIAARKIARACPTERVGVLLPPGSDAVIANLGTWLAGKQVINLNVTIAPAALAAACRDAGIRHLIGSHRFLAKLRQRGIDLEPALTPLTFIDIETLRPARAGWRWMPALAVAVLAPAWLLAAASGARRVQPEDTAAILIAPANVPKALPGNVPGGLPGDETGQYKAVELSHRNIAANAGQIIDVLNVDTDDALLANLPLFHALGLTLTTCAPLLAGVPMVCHPDPTDAVGTAKTIARFRATVLCSTSSLLGRLLDEPRVHPMMLEPLRLVITSAERLRPAVREGFALRFKKPIFEGYGATEVTPLASVNVPDAIETQHWKVQIGCKPGSVGMPLPGTCFRIVDPETLATQPPGSAGLILIGGVPIMKGYLDDPERTAAAIIALDGRRWFNSGDIGYLDADGFLTITEQRADFAKMGGPSPATAGVAD